MPNTAFTVNAGTLGGNGTIGGFTALSGAIVAPGNSIDTLTVNGNFTLDPGAIFEVELDPTPNHSDKAVVTGTVNSSARC
jgi:fibronectin-binding autotransporter adhesin